MTIYSFRAECPADVDLFEQQCMAAGLGAAVRRVPDPVFPDIDVEMVVDAPIEILRNLFRRVLDGHVMIQTLRACPLSENSLERNCDLR